MTDNLVPSFAKIFMIKAVDSSLVQVAFTVPMLRCSAGSLYHQAALTAGVRSPGIHMVGAFGYIPAAILQSFNLFLV